MTSINRINRTVVLEALNRHRTQNGLNRVQWHHLLVSRASKFAQKLSGESRELRNPESNVRLTELLYRPEEGEAVSWCWFDGTDIGIQVVEDWTSPRFYGDCKAGTPCTHDLDDTPEKPGELSLHLPEMHDLFVADETVSCPWKAIK